MILDGELRIREAVETDAAVMSEIQIRSFRAAYRGVVPASYLDGLDPGRWQEIWTRRVGERDGGRTVLVAEMDGEVVGFAYLGPSPDPDRAGDGHLFSIHLDPERRGRGLGASLMDEVVRLLALAGFGHATLWVMEANQPAQRFYRRLGWRPDGARRIEGLALEGEPGPSVEVVRFRRALDRAGTPSSKPGE